MKQVSGVSGFALDEEYWVHDRPDIAALIERLDEIIRHARELEAQFADALEKVHPKYRASAENLVHYVALRQFDIRRLQIELGLIGLSSLGRAEKNVLASLTAVRNCLETLSSGAQNDIESGWQAFEASEARLREHVNDALGDNPDGRNTRIMVTMPTIAASDYEFVNELVAAGMDLARINCAHDDKEAWLAMVENIRRAAKENDRVCRIAMDLAGPKIRTGDLEPAPGIVRIRPERDPLGRVIKPRRVCLVPEDTRWLPKKCDVVPVPRSFFEAAETGDVVRFSDTRGKRRGFTVVKKNQKALKLSGDRRAYIAAGTELRLERNGEDLGSAWPVGSLPAADEPIVLYVGDTLILHKAQTPGEPAVRDEDGNVMKPAHIACRQPEVFDFVQEGDPIALNDGKIEGTVTSASEDDLFIEITHAKEKGGRLRSDKGINFPASDIAMLGLTETDKQNLGFIAEHADAVSLSFVRKPRDIVALQRELERRDATDLGMITKIETKKAFNDLPRLLLTTMRHYPAAMMIARGDLAVECGWERLAEIQEEMLWMCEAAQVPVIWATAVLERETRTGQPSRAEITDAAMSQRAECVMLNKGPYVLAAIHMLDNILRRMQSHQLKKTPKLRKLRISEV